MLRIEWEQRKIHLSSYCVSEIVSYKQHTISICLSLSPHPTRSGEKCNSEKETGCYRVNSDRCTLNVRGRMDDKISAHQMLNTWVYTFFPLKFRDSHAVSRSTRYHLKRYNIFFSHLKTICFFSSLFFAVASWFLRASLWTTQYFPASLSYEWARFALFQMTIFH